MERYFCENSRCRFHIKVDTEYRVHKIEIPVGFNQLESLTSNTNLFRKVNIKGTITDIRLCDCCAQAVKLCS